MFWFTGNLKFVERYFAFVVFIFECLLVTVIFAMLILGLGLPCMPPLLSSLGLAGIKCPSWDHIPEVSLWYLIPLSLLSAHVWAVIIALASVVICIPLVHPGIIQCGMLKSLERYVIRIL